MEIVSLLIFFWKGFVKETKTSKTEQCKYFLFEMISQKIYLGIFECAEKYWMNILMLYVSNNTAHIWLETTKAVIL